MASIHMLFVFHVSLAQLPITITSSCHLYSSQMAKILLCSHHHYSSTSTSTVVYKAILCSVRLLNTAAETTDIHNTPVVLSTNRNHYNVLCARFLINRLFSPIAGATATERTFAGVAIFDHFYQFQYFPPPFPAINHQIDQNNALSSS